MAALTTRQIPSVVVERIAAFWKHYNISIGVKGIDAQHIWLIALVLYLEWMLHHSKEDEVPPGFADVLEEAFHYTKSHFDAEERLFGNFYFPEGEKHIEQHRNFTSSLARLAQKYDSLERIEAEKLYRLLKQWLIQHIQKEDMTYAEFFRRRKLQQEANAWFDKMVAEGTVELRTEQRDLFQKVSANEHDIDCSTPEILEKTKTLWNQFNLKIGVPIIDIQHLWLVKMIADMDVAMNEPEMTKVAVLSETLAEAMEYIRVHFRTEELLMQKIGFAELSSHIKQHEIFEEFIKKRKAELDGGNYRKAMNIMIDLREWLNSHILIQDRKYVKNYSDNKEEALKFSRELISSGKAHVRQNQINLYKIIVQDKGGI